ncbi:MAG TPA: hypothetical protein VFE24_13185 [Pirellulales bacterium]|nr:hypothetical protein [Pirellulales bacterium]
MRRFLTRETVGRLADRERHLLGALELALQRRSWHAGELREFQTCTLQALLTYAYERVPFYRAKYQAAGFTPAQFQRWDDLLLIPRVTKAELRAAPLADLKSSDDPAPCRLLASSGSTGISGRLFLDESALTFYAAQNLLLYYDWCQGRPYSEVLYFIDLSPDAIDYAFADQLRTTVAVERLVDAALPAAVHCEQIRRLKPEFISSYPSTMRNIALTFAQENHIATAVRLLHLTSEMFDAATAALLRRVFPQAKIVETYTSTEFGLLAARCAAGRWHWNEAAAVGEVVDEAGCPTAQTGELVVTNLMNWATPLIRYQGLGDYGCWGAADCGCGASRRSLERLEGRVAETLFRDDGTPLTPYALTNRLEETPGLRQFQVIQHDTARLELQVVRDPAAGISASALRAALEAACMQVLGRGIVCSVCLVDTIAARQGSHKTPLVVSPWNKRGGLA